MSELKPCPFCGSNGKDLEKYFYPSSGVIACSCGARIEVQYAMYQGKNIVHQEAPDDAAE